MNLISVLLLLSLHERIDRLAASGQVVEIGMAPSARLSPPARIAPGPPPTLGFRLIEGRLRHRFGDLDLVLDDAGHE